MTWNGNSELTFHQLKKRREEQIGKLIKVFNDAGFIIINTSASGVAPAMPPGYQTAVHAETLVQHAQQLRDALAHFDPRLGDATAE